MVSVPMRLSCFLSIGTVTTLGQEDPNFCLQSEDLLYNTEPYREQYSWVCCNNERMAEHRGFQDRADVNFWGQLEADPRATNGGEFTFYDAQCGIPLYVAPRGRSFEAWRDESHHHGWPSFRDEERVTENLREVGHGEMISTCGTHLGHNIPDGRNRDCINLICMAGVSSGNGTLHLASQGGGNDTQSGGSGEMPESSGGSGGSGEMPESSATSGGDGGADAAEESSGANDGGVESVDSSGSRKRSVQVSFFLVSGSLGVFAMQRHYD